MYGELEIALHRSHPEAYDVELRLTDPETEGEIAPEKGQAAIGVTELLWLQSVPDKYGDSLAAQFLRDDNIRNLYGKGKGIEKDGAPRSGCSRWRRLKAATG